MVAAVKRVGKSGLISRGKKRAGRHYREETQDHWLVRDKDKIVEAMEWAAESPRRATKLDPLIAKAQRPKQKQKQKQKQKKKAPSR
ncbi:MAG: hypothetical protein IT384_06500 [Deltaproteobacteria bacterium]|nr:hypothetical protein [Deltaproteobacteria bacterium]